jgi:eukaryotic-like serine/threonine-protein kinase
MGTTTPPNRVDHVEELIRTQAGGDSDRTVIDGPPTGPTGPAQLGTATSIPYLPATPVAPPRHSAAHAQELRAGVLVGEYEILGKLGQGGMGVVYAATHPVIGKKAAVKVLRAKLCADVEAVERFIQEARAVNQIGHPNIVDIFAFGELPDGRSYLVMEMLAGESLQARMRRGPLLRDELCHYVDAISRALEAAHDKKVIHRDLKPDNVFLHELRGERPVVKLLDFGIAKLVDTDDHRTAQTREGAMMGTPQYISPEQARGYAIDYRADVYSLGVMLFEMIAGRPPFVADNAMDMVAKHLYETPPRLSSLAPETPSVVEDLVALMLDKDPMRRPPLARVRRVIDELRASPDGAFTEPAIRMSAVDVAPRGQRRRRMRRIAMAIAAVLAVGGGVATFAIVRSMRTEPEAPQPQPPAASAGREPQPPPATAGREPQPQPQPAPPPTPPAVPATVPVTVELDYAGRAELSVDGVVQDGTRGWSLALPPGRHELSVRAITGGGTWHETIDVVAGAPRAITVKLARKPARTPRRVPSVSDDPDELLAPAPKKKGK